MQMYDNFDGQAFATGNEFVEHINASHTSNHIYGGSVARARVCACCVVHGGVLVVVMVVWFGGGAGRGVHLITHDGGTPLKASVKWYRG